MHFRVSLESSAICIHNRSFITRLESGPLCAVPLGISDEPPLRVMAYADDVCFHLWDGGGGLGDEAVC